MIPLRNTLASTTVPWATRSIILINVAIFLVQFFSGKFGEVLVHIFGFVPARLFHPSLFNYSLVEAFMTLMTSLFLHGGLIHIAGNLLYLGVFGGRVEERLGPFRFTMFYLACGAAGSLTHAFLFPNSRIPSIGASGCIAGVLGAFLFLYPRGKIVTLFPLVISWVIAEVPAVVFLPVWLSMQFMNGWLVISSARSAQGSAGIAWWAHVGGFVFGAMIAIVARSGETPAGRGLAKEQISNPVDPAGE